MWLQLTVVNTDYLRELTSAGDEWRLAATYIPSVMRSTVRQLAGLAGDVDAAMTLLVAGDCDAVDRWRRQLRYPPDFRCLGVGGWLALNDTEDKAAVLAESTVDRATTTSIYAALTGCPDLSAANLSSCLHFDVNSTSFSATTPVSEMVRALLELRGANASSHNVTSTSDRVAAALCPRSEDADSCLAVRRRSAAAYVRVLSAYVTMHLAAYAFYRAVSILAKSD